MPSNYGTNLGKALSQNSTAGGSNLPAEDNPDGDNPCYSCDQQGADSRFIGRLNAGDDTPGAGPFTQIATDDDEIIPSGTASGTASSREPSAPGT